MNVQQFYFLMSYVAKAAGFSFIIWRLIQVFVLLCFEHLTFHIADEYPHQLGLIINYNQ